MRGLLQDPGAPLFTILLAVEAILPELHHGCPVLYNRPVNRLMETADRKSVV